MKVPHQDFLPQLETCVKDFFALNKTNASRIHPQYEILWRELERVTRSGGKRIRPQMALLSYSAYGGQDVNSLVRVAAGLEVLHSSLLIHDDIIDRELTRRGSLNITGVYDQTYYSGAAAEERLHHSNSAALLGGDLLLTASLQLLETSHFPADRLASARTIMHRIIFAVAGGQLLDSEAAFLPDKRASTLTIARYKTASYSFVGPLLIGAALASDVTPQDELEIFAIQLGIAYQLSDDLLSTFGDESQTGKSTSSDLREGKFTHIIEAFLDTAAADDHAVFTSLFGKPEASDTDIATLKELIKQSDAVAQTEKVIDQHVENARQTLARLKIDDHHRAAFEDLISRSVKRLA